MPKKKKEAYPGSAIDDFLEWQEHQYTPGYYTGGKVHPLYKTRNKAVQYFILITSILGIVMMVLSALRLLLTKSY